LDVAINLFASYNPSIKKEMANPDPQHMEMIKENLRNFAIGILEAAKKMRATTA
jgi:ABC-type Zn uptake system ZnuABC Zn-binding protein ZnuA